MQLIVELIYNNSLNDGIIGFIHPISSFSRRIIFHRRCKYTGDLEVVDRELTSDTAHTTCQPYHRIIG